MKVKLVADILDANSQLARQNRQMLSEKGILTLNLMGSPGAGKTTLLEQTIDVIGKAFKIAIIEGDIFTTRDADRISQKGVQVVQINTGGACHLDAGITGRALQKLELDAVDLLIIENVGNLVCPAEFDLGEDVKVMVASIAEGDDKPAKYPLMYSESSAVIMNKVDLLPYTDFDMGRFISDTRKLNPDVRFFPVSAVTGEGLENWSNWLKELIKNKVRQRYARGTKGA